MRSPATSVGGSPVLEQGGAGLQSGGRASDLKTGFSPGSSRRPAVKRTTRVEAFPEALKPSFPRMNAGAPTEAKKRLIATHAKLEIATTFSQQRTSLFLIATKNAFPELRFCQFPCDTVADSLQLGLTSIRPFVAQGNPSGEIQFLPHGRDNFSSGFNIVSSEASRVLEVYNPGRFLRRHP